MIETKQVYVELGLGATDVGSRRFEGMLKCEQFSSRLVILTAGACGG